jgi:hypothetical protein
MNKPNNESTAERSRALCPFEVPTQSDICRAFNVALLLTGNTILAEATVLSAMEALADDDICRESLLAEVIRISVRFRTDWCDHQPNRLNHPRPPLPVELQNVLKLPTELRHAFVLRTLLGLSPEVAAGILQCDENQVNAHLLAAMQALAPRLQATTICAWSAPLAVPC